MRRLSSLSLVAGLLLLAAACSAAGSARAPVTSRDVITRDQLRLDDAESVHAVVERLRPHWLRKRGSNTVRDDGDIVVYVDDTRMGGPEVLRQILASQVESARFLDAGRAQYRFGVGHAYGAIVVTSRSR